MEPHGRLDLRWSGNVLHIEAFGPFNDEGTAAATEAYFKVLDDNPHDTFAVIEVLTDDAVGPPEAMTEVAKMWQFLGERGCVALALVYSNIVQRELAEPHLPDYGKAFHSKEDAENWIREILLN